MRRRALLVLLAAAAFAGSWWLARPLPRPKELPGPRAPAWITLLGPLRLFLADLIELRFEANRNADEVFGQLDDAWSVLALAPARVDRFLHFAGHFLFDAVRHADSAPARAACVRAGFQMLERGRALHPRSARLAFAQARFLEHLARRSPERIGALALPPDRPAAGLALECHEQALDLAAPDDPLRGEIVASFVLGAADLAGDASAPEPWRARAREDLRRLQGEPALPAPLREAIERALAPSDGR